MDIRQTKEFKAAERFMQRNARPLDMAMWNMRYHGGSIEKVLNALAAFQNEDGGFGWGLECDSLNPESSPMQTLTACGVLREAGFEDGSHPIIQGILRYLASGRHFDENCGQWFSAIPSNNNYPHAIWWSYDPAITPDKSPLPYNPTAGLAGFILRFADRSSELWRKAMNIAEEAISVLKSGRIPPETHVTGSFAVLYYYMKQAGITDEYGLADTLRTRAQAEIPNDSSRWEDEYGLGELLRSRGEAEICRDSSRWATEYVPKPSDYISSKDSVFYPGFEQLCREECEIIRRAQLPDGSFPVTWQWFTDYQEFALSSNWWRSRFILINIHFLEVFGE